MSSAESLNDAPIDPTKLYEIQECVGKGNFGDVYKAKDKSTNKIVAVKVVNLEETDDEIDVMVQEIAFLSQLRSKYITNYYKTFVRDVSMWIVMEYCGGGSCSDLLKCHKRLSEDVVGFIIKETLKGLQYLHKENKIHRDIKAANILLTSSGQVKLADFGVSGQITATRVKKDTFVGTPFWMAPEVISRNSGYNEKVDIWSLGITTIELLTGAPPFADKEPMKVLFQIPKNPPPVLVGAEHSEYVKEFIRFCLIKNPNNRPSASVLSKTKFIRIYRRGVSLVPYIQQKDEWMAVHRPNARRPRYNINDKLYTKSEASFRWNFNTNKKTSIESPQSSDDSPNISDDVSPMTGGYIDSSETQLTSPESHHINNLDSTESQTAIRHEIYKAEDKHLQQQQQYQQEVSIDSVFQEPPSIDYLNDVMFYCLKRVHHRAKTKDTKLTVSDLGKHFFNAEKLQPGLAEALSEEIWLRMCQLRDVSQ